MSSTDDSIVIGIVAVYWVAWWLLAIVFKRSWIPVIPFMPLALLAAGLGINWLIPWIGALLVTGVHGWLVVNTVKAVRFRS